MPTWLDSGEGQAPVTERLVFYFRTTSASTAPCTSRRMCCGCAALRMVLVTVPRVSRSCEQSTSFVRIWSACISPRFPLPKLVPDGEWGSGFRDKSIQLDRFPRTKRRVILAEHQLRPGTKLVLCGSGRSAFRLLSCILANCLVNHGI